MKTYKLRLWIPLLVLIASMATIAFMLLFQTAQLSKNLQQEKLADVRQLMSRLQGRIEENLSRHRTPQIEREITTLGTVHEIGTLVLLDQRQNVQFALRYAWKHQPIDRVYPRFDEKKYRRVIADKQPRIEYLPTWRTIQAYYPIRLNPTAKQIRSPDSGVLFIEYDLSQPLALIWYESLIESLLLEGIFVVLMLALFHILSWLVTRPVSHLLNAIQQYAKEGGEIRTALSGDGELAMLERSIVQLSKRLNNSRNALVQQINQYNLLSKTNQMITRVKTEQILFDETCQLVVDHGGFILAWIGLIENGRIANKVRAVSGPAQAFLRQWTQTVSVIDNGDIPALLEREGFVIINDYQQNPLTARLHGSARRFDIAAAAAFAIKQCDGHDAIFKVYADRDNFFTEDIVRLLRSMADDLSYALTNLRLDRLRLQAENDLREREENLAITLNSIGDAVIATDDGGRITRMNPVAERLTGWQLASARGRPLDEVFRIVNSETRQVVESPVLQVLKLGRIVGLANHTSLLSRNGKEYQIADSAAPITNRDGKTIGVILVFQDITEQYKIQSELAANEQRFRHANEVSGAYVFELDPQLRYTYVTDKVIQVKGHQPEQLIGRQPFDFMLEEDVAPNRLVMLQAIADNGEFSLSHRNVAANGEILWEEVKGQMLLDDDGNVHKIRGAGISINERKRAESEIEQLAYFDPLTNLPNRRMIIDRLNHELPAAKRHRYYGAILFFDLDHFKHLNDSLGHNAGDELLIQIARRLNGSLRAEDTAARLGGDEFIVLLNNVDENQSLAVDKVRKVVEKIRRALLAPYMLEGHEYHLSLSIGITLFPQPDQSVNDLLKQADTALYQTKADGRNHYQFFRPEMQEMANQRLLMEKELHAALAEDQLQLHYQPQFDAEGRVIGAEVLLRWQHPEKGFISPEHFIPVAEESALILKLSRWVLQTALLQMTTWLQKGIMTPQHTMSINISPKQFKQETFVSEVSMIIRQYNLPPNTIMLEITENLLLTHIEKTIEKMQQLKKIGVNFSIDDFGTGYSSLAYLKRLPLGELKIDKTFIKDISRDSNDQAIIETIIAMAKHMKLKVIAEGVETDEQFEFLNKQGCYHYQGYYYSKPLEQSAFEAFLSRNH